MAQYSPMVMASTGAINTTDQWYFTKDDMRHTPSIAGSDYMTPNGSNNKLVSQAEELQWRWRSGNFISNVAKKLDMNQIVVSTACVFFHRFYMRQTISQYHPYQVAGACIFLASKVEENKRSFKDIVMACSFVAAKGNVKQAAADQETWKRLLKRLEIVVLENCCFDLEITHPYTYIDTLAQELGIPVYIAKSACAFINDTMRSPLCLLYRPDVAAVAALYVAMGVHGHQCTSDCLFESRKMRLADGAERQVEDCAMYILEFYKKEAEHQHQLQQQQQQQQRHHHTSPPY